MYNSKLSFASISYNNIHQTQHGYSLIRIQEQMSIIDDNKPLKDQKELTSFLYA